MIARLTQLPSACSGNIAIMTALVTPVLMMFVGAGIDFQRWNGQRAQLQEFADTLAIRGAREFLLAGASESRIEAVLQALADGDMGARFGDDRPDLDVRVVKDEASVAVRLTQPAPESLMLKHFQLFDKPVAVRAEAVARGGMNVCVIALKEHGTGAVSLQHNAVLDATPCSVLSNSDSALSVTVAGSSKIKAGMICSAGGATGGNGSFSPEPTTDCPVYADPLVQREPPPVGACTHHNYQVGYIISQGSGGGQGLVRGLLGTVGGVVETVGDITQLPLIEQRVSPGVYCGGLSIKRKARVTFDPGVYVIKDGPLEVGEASTLEGDYIAFHLLGAASVFNFDRAAKISMSAPKTGPLAGILFFEDRNAPLDRIHAIYSNDARRLLGTFYLPRGTLLVDTQTPVADVSAYTAIVTRGLDLRGAPTLALNADYGATDVPVPDGVGPVGGEVYLRE